MKETCGTPHFSSVKDQIGCCGIWCGSCVVGNGVLRYLTDKYGELLKTYGLHEWGPTDFDWSEFRRCMGSLAAVRVCVGCRKGGGRDNCEMRACASKKGLDECAACGERGACNHGGILEHMRTGAVAAGLFVKTDETDKQRLIEEWTAELRKRWPSCVLFAE